MEVKRGASITLECRASGNPVPVITWTRKTFEQEKEEEHDLRRSEIRSGMRVNSFEQMEANRLWGRR
ncbi:hypothetical protein RUM44_007390 [Polyplax serrata]|uniref:Ig-like domain-containing protein n=1 Tax=Polyplax serrata TaxID=468196 RepID=A0ABR1B0J0_POLSC